MFFSKKVSGQGAFDYLLMTGAAILIVAVVIVALSGVVVETKDQNSVSDYNKQMNDLTDLQNRGDDDHSDVLSKVKDKISPVVTLISPAPGFSTTNTNVDFNFKVSDANSIVKNCYLIVNGVVNGVGSSSVIKDVNQTFSRTLSIGNYTWDVNCVDGNLNKGGSGQSRDFNIKGTFISVSNCVQLQDMNSNLDENYVLLNDINCYNATHLNGVLYNGGAGFSPIPNFTGTFDGNFHKITGIYINRSTTDNVGLFGAISSSKVKLKNVGLVDVNIIGGNSVGGLVGSYSNGVGSSLNSSNNYVTGFVKGQTYVGGLVGFTTGGYFENNYTNVTVNGQTQVGGFAGLFNCSDFRNNYSLGNVTGTGTYVGGFIGIAQNCGSIINNYSTGSVSGGNYVGGFAGYFFSVNEVFNNFSAVSSVSGSNSGGFVGESYVPTGLSTGASYLLNNYTTYSSCGNNVSCTPNTVLSNLYVHNGSSYPVYYGSPNWGGNWNWSGSALPTLTWQ